MRARPQTGWIRVGGWTTASQPGSPSLKEGALAHCLDLIEYEVPDGLGSGSTVIGLEGPISAGQGWGQLTEGQGRNTGLRSSDSTSTTLLGCAESLNVPLRSSTPAGDHRVCRDPNRVKPLREVRMDGERRGQLRRI